MASQLVFGGCFVFCGCLECVWRLSGMLLSGMCLMGVCWQEEGVWKVTYGYVLVHRVQSVTNFLNAQTLWTYRFGTRNFFRSNILVTMFFCNQTYQNPNSLDQTNLNPNFFGTNNLLGVKLFWIQISFGPKNFWDQDLFCELNCL